MEIAIIGAGAAAVGLLDSLDPSAVESVTVYDPAPLPWRGRPYGPDLESVRVNVPPETMSIRAGDPEHYGRWLGGTSEYDDPWLGRPVPPRAVYGRYLADTAAAALARFARTDVVRAAVTGLALGAPGERITVETAGGRRMADAAVLCVGGGAAPDPYGLAGAPGFVLDPYPLERTLDGIPADRDVAVIGSGLTAVDVVVSLAARAHTGRISLVSRSGTLPHVWQTPMRTDVRHLTPERVRALDGPVTLARLETLLRKELADGGDSWEDVTALIDRSMSGDAAAVLREQFALIDSPLPGRRIVRTLTHTAGPFAWRRLAEADRRRLRRHARAITIQASPMVPRNAAVLLDLLDAGTLEILSGAGRIEESAGRFRVAHAGGVRAADAVVNAVNAPAHAVPRAAEPLVSSLLGQGAARHPDGGLTVDPGTGRLVLDGRPDPRVLVAGDLAGDGPFLTTSVPGVVALAARAAKALVSPR
ncbi:FAD/NAD(P)-binding protein [Actinomadura algeriensis]|uniref:NAD(P)/FAD-binding protein YdhS n=1 Tax=Actinomadura algeriensis TaxID=1679523 RepID=A0ABR9JQ39_9ACTN|nr:FAD/NAD(P)-binding protein [Actinomadura algeriensis]MBE1532676.1 putative NAD(P)/FAD-binding protein YdhS [Actinomadura algeriensis]